MFDIVSRTQAVILRSIGETLAIIQQQTGITPRHVWNLYTEAQQRGWEPGILLKIEHVQNRDRCGRKKKITPAVEQAIMDAVIKDQYGREKILVQLGLQFSISS
ncbi:hypothetical protein EV426DRAFT_195391 [Tirmania nivea]|nr:hypothetical protein EV426DRAFT_195391 [Tirmania nivea]